MNKLLWIPFLFAIAACAKESDEEVEGGDESFGAGMAGDPHSGMRGGMQGMQMPADSGPSLQFQAPAEWKALPPAGMRRAQYVAPDRDKKEGDATFIYFGSMNGTVDAHVTRWQSQIGRPQGESTVQTYKNGDIAVTVLDMTGDYAGDSGEAVPNTRFIGAIVATPKDGLHFFKFYGPPGTIDDWRDAVVEMLKNAKMP